MKRCTKIMKPIEKMKETDKYNFGFGVESEIKDPIRVKINEIIERINYLDERRKK